MTVELPRAEPDLPGPARRSLPRSLPRRQLPRSRSFRGCLVRNHLLHPSPGLHVYSCSAQNLSTVRTSASLCSQVLLMRLNDELDKEAQAAISDAERYLRDPPFPPSRPPPGKRGPTPATAPRFSPRAPRQSLGASSVVTQGKNPSRGRGDDEIATGEIGSRQHGGRGSVGANGDPPNHPSFCDDEPTASRRERGPPKANGTRASGAGGRRVATSVRKPTGESPLVGLPERVKGAAGAAEGQECEEPPNANSLGPVGNAPVSVAAHRESEQGSSGSDPRSPRPRCRRHSDVRCSEGRTPLRISGTPPGEGTKR